MSPAEKMKALSEVWKQLFTEEETQVMALTGFAILMSQQNAGAEVREKARKLQIELAKRELTLEDVLS